MAEKIVKDSQGLVNDLVNDTISRRAAIDATWFEPSYTDPLNVLTEVRDRLKALPPAQPEVAKDTNVLTNDCISRQAVIDALENIDCSDGIGISALKCDVVEDAINAINALPSAQPEIIRCLDCKYWEREEPFTSIGRCGIWAYTHRKGSDYCSEAREVNE